jgi:hypothetical protein
MGKWKPIPQFAITYEVSDDGRIVRISLVPENGRQLKVTRKIVPQNKSRNGYMMIDIQRNRRHLKYSVHRVVWEAHRGKIPSGMDINHRDGDKTNNRLDNLELMTRSENMLHFHRRVRPNRNHARTARYKTKLTPDDVRNILALDQSGLSPTEIAQRYSVTDGAISHILHGRNWRRITGFKPQRNGHVRGVRHPHAKLTPEGARNILDLHRAGMSLAKIGRRYNVSGNAVLSILRGESWSHETGIKPI